MCFFCQKTFRYLWRFYSLLFRRGRSQHTQASSRATPPLAYTRGHHVGVSPGEDTDSEWGLAPKKKSSEEGGLAGKDLVPWLFRGFFVALFCLEKQCLGLFRGFFVALVLGKIYAYSPWNSLLILGFLFFIWGSAIRSRSGKPNLRRPDSRA